MCEEKDCDCNHGKHHRYHHGWHHRHHKGYASLVKRRDDQVIVPEALLEVADVGIGDFLEITVRKVLKNP